MRLLGWVTFHLSVNRNMSDGSFYLNCFMLIAMQKYIIHVYHVAMFDLREYLKPKYWFSSSFWTTIPWVDFFIVRQLITRRNNLKSLEISFLQHFTLAFYDE